MQMAKRLCGPRMIKSHEAWLKTFFYKSGKTQRTLFSNTQIWSRVLSSKVPSEFKYYCQGRNSILKGTSPKELAAYSNRFVTQEVKVICPFWHASVVGACGVHKSEEKEMKASNAIALATSATSRMRNQRMSALASCISVILLLSGAKTQDFTRLNKLGVSMSHRQSIRLQTAMGHNFNGKVLQWKKNREEVLGAMNPCHEVMSKQIPVFPEDAMELEIWCDLSEDTLKLYEFFTPGAYSLLMEVRTFKANDDDDSCVPDSTIQGVLSKLEGRKVPRYR